MAPCLDFLVLEKILNFEICKGWDLKPDNISFSNLCLKIHKQVIIGPKLEDFFVFHKILKFEELKSLDFKYENIFLKIGLKKTPLNNVFLYQI